MPLRVSARAPPGVAPPRSPRSQAAAGTGSPSSPLTIVGCRPGPGPVALRLGRGSGARRSAYAKLALDARRDPRPVRALRDRLRDVARLRSRAARARAPDPRGRADADPDRGRPADPCAVAGPHRRPARPPRRRLAVRRDVRDVPRDRRGGSPSVTATADRVASVMERYEAVIGIEIHCQLRTASKMFCGCSNTYADAAPNTHVCPVCLALPGVLPVINRRAVEFVIATGIAIEATIPERTQWERKNYFYPDLPKGYQISQYAIPLAARGRLRIETSDGPFTVPITRAHLEEDTAKLVHGDSAATGQGGARTTLVDF